MTFSAKDIGLGVVILLLVVGTVVVYAKKSSVHEEVDALAEALSRRADNEGQLERRISELGAELDAAREEMRRLGERTAHLDRLAAEQQREIAGLESRLDALRAGVVGSASEESPAASASRDAEGVRGDIAHVVQRGDLLQDLAGRYYGDRTAWRRILDANAETVRDARSLRPGMILVIPGVGE